ncbi:MAG: peptidoglycan DD-metalloendopeptidase family protein [Gammaproteobacteria bacterium]|nr:peptidoglycan DD-metalloendopeptidase family protein [Gammaproteobacteria bacterium]
MVPKAAAQLIAQHLYRHRRPHLAGAAVGVLLLSIILILVSGSANAVRSKALIERFEVPLYIPEIGLVDYQLPSEPVWQELTIRPGDSLTSLLQRANLSPQVVAKVIEHKTARRQLHRLIPGDKFRVQVEPGDKPRLLGIDYKLKDDRILSVRLDDDGHYYPILQQPEYEHRMRFATGTVQTSLYEAALASGLSDNLTMQLTEIFGWDIDFALDIRQGDSFSVLYDVQYHRGEQVADGTILAAEFTSQGRTYQAIRFVEDNGRSQYYSPDGRSLRKAFLRTPVDFRRISSRFGKRFHPVHKKVKQHSGVDYAARAGTPIRATGDGKIVYRGRKGGYGKTIIIRHGNVDTTLYAHMRHYARGMRPGRYVRQGQIIGFVGQTGTATGPHLHYEFRVHGVHRNPLTVRLPDARPIKRQYKSRFAELLQARNNQMGLYKTRHLAMTEVQ